MKSTRAWMVLGLAAGMCACASDARAQGSVAEDRAALIAFYDTVDERKWHDDENWASDAPLGEWSGVATDESGRVKKLEVWFGRSPGNGAIPAELGSLTKLEVLDLSGLPPMAGAPIPQFRGSIPAEFGNLRMLKELNLAYNDLIGPIPAELANLTKLEKLILGDGWSDSYGLNGPIPAWLGNLTQLEVLHLGGNWLNGPIPAELGNLTQLEVLHLGGNRFPPSINQLDGVIPEALGNLTNLQLLNLENNVLSGSIPAVLWELTDLVELDLSGNMLSGTIPVELGSFTRLERLDLSSNQLSGPFPGVLRLPNLLRVDLSSNQWSGPLPGDAAKLANLEMLHSGRGRLRDAVEAGIERFAGEAGQLVALTGMSHGFDARFRLLSPAGERLAVIDVNGLGGSEFQLAWLPSDGQYRIEVIPRRGFRDYEVDVRAVPVEPLTVGQRIDPFLAAGLRVRAWRFRGTAGHIINVDARTWLAGGMDSVAPKLMLLSSSDGKRLGSESTDHYYTWSLTGAVLPRTEDYVLIYAYPNKYDTMPVRVVVRASAPE